MKRTATPIRSSRRARAAHRVSTGFTLAPLALAALVLTQGAQALPTGLQPVVGTVQVTRPDANTMVMTTGQQKTIVNTQTFGIGAQERLTVNQPGSTSTTMFSVLGYDPSYILGQLQSNGRIFLQNPNGIVFGANARVDVGGLVATTLRLSDTDFLAGRYLLADNGQGQGDLAGRVINQGSINATGGAVVLAGADVLNSGTIQADGGRVGLIAANKVLVDVEGDGLLFFEVDGREAGTRLQQLGRIQADGGSVELMAASRGQFADTVLNMSGVVQARTLGLKNGRVVIDGGSAGATLVSGEVDVSGRGAGETGGTVTVVGDKVGLVGAAHINASGDAGGGTVLVGGDVHGTGDRRANSTFVGAGARIEANAQTRGDGGKVVVWADGTTRYFGQINARGGLLGGNGGFAEVSGRGHLDFLGSVDLSAPRGAKGMLLLDPSNIEVVSSGGVDLTTVPDAEPSDNGYQFEAKGADSGVSQVSRDSIVKLLDTTSVHLIATHSITVNAAIDASASTADSGLALIAGNGAGDAVNLNADISTKAGLLVIGRSINVGADVSLNSGSTQLRLDGEVNGGSHNLSLASSFNDAAAIQSTGKITGVTQLGVTGRATLGGDVTTTGNQGYSGQVTLSANATLDAGAAKLSLDGGVNGGTHNLTLKSTHTDADAIKTGAAIGGVAALTVTGKSTLGGDVTTTGNQSYSGQLTLASNATLDAGTAKLSLDGGVSGGAHDLTLKSSNAGADAVKTGAAIGNVAALTVTGKSTLGGNVTTTGAQTYSGTVTLADNVNFRGGSLGFTNSTTSIQAGGKNLGLRADTITVGGTVNSAGGNTVTFEPGADNGTLTVATTSSNPGLLLTPTLLNKFSGFANITLGSLANPYTIAVGSLSLPTALTAYSSSGNISFGKLGGGSAVTAQTTGRIDLNDVIGGSVDADKLASLSLNGQIHVNTGSVRTTGNQSYTASTGTVALSQDTALDAGAGTITASAIDGGDHSLSLTSGNAASNAVQLGAVDHVSTLVVSGKATLAGDVTTTGTQTYNQAVTLSQSGVTTLTGSTVTLKSTLDGTADGVQGVKVAGGASISGAVGGGKKLASVEVTGQTTLGGNVSTTGNQSYGGQLTLGGNAVLDAGAGKVALSSVNGGTHNLTLNSSNAAADAIQTSGAISEVAALVVNGRSTLGGDVSTSGSQTYGNTVTLSKTDAAYTFTGSALNFNNGLAAGNNDLAFHADSALAIAGALSGTGHVSIAGQRADKAIVVGGAAAGPDDLVISDSTLALFGSTFSGVTVGRADGTAAITFGNYTLTRDLGVLNGSGSVTFNALEGAHALTVQTNGGLITLAGNIGNVSQPTALTFQGDVRLANSFVFTSGAQTYGGAVTLAQDVQLNAHGVTFGGAVDSASGGAHSLTINAGGSAVQFTHAVGAQQALSTMAVSSDTTSVAGNVNTSVSQTYTGNVVLTGDATFRAPTLTFNNALQAGAHNLGLLADSQPVVGGALSGTGDIRIGAYTDSTTIGVAGGAGSLQIDQGRIDQLGAAGFRSVTIGSTTGTGDIMVGSASSSLTLPSDLTVQSQSGNITLGGAVDGAHSLTLNTSGVTTIGAAVGGNTALTALRTDAGGSTHLNAGVRTSGDQTYGDAVELGNSVSITGATSTFAGTLDSAGGSNNSLTIIGNAAFGAAVGTGQRLGALYVSGSAQLGGNISTTGSQTYVGAVTLSHDVALDSSGSYIYFPAGSSVDGGFDLTLTSASANYLYGSIGSTTPLGSLTANGLTYVSADAIHTAGAQTYAGQVTTFKPSTTFTGTDVAFNGGLSSSADVNVNASGAATLGGASVSVAKLSVSGDALINAASVTTNGSQNYGGNVVLGSSSALNGNTIDFHGTVQAAANGVQGLTVNDSGTTTFHGDVGGGGQALASLSTSAGGTTVLPAHVTTTGAQSYGDTAQLATATVLTASQISFNGGVLGASQGLTAHLPGTLLFKGSVSDLGSLAVDGGGITQFDGTNGLTTSGEQHYGGAVEILGGSDARFVASALRFDGKVSGARNLVLNADTVTAGELAGTGELQVAPTSAGRSIDLTGGAADVSIDLAQVSGFTQRTIGRADGTGSITAGALNLGANTTVQNGSGAVHFNGTVDGPYALTVQSNGTVDIKGDVGASVALTSLNTTGNVVFGGNLIRTTGAQTYAGDFTTDVASRAFSIDAGSLSLNSSQGLAFNRLHLVSGGAVTVAGRLALVGNVDLDGGVLTLESKAGPGAGSTIRDADGTSRNDVVFADRPLLGADVAIAQTGGTINTAAGSTLNLRASGGGSISVEHVDAVTGAENQIQGSLSAVSGTPGEVGSARFHSGSGPLVVSTVNLRAANLHAAGIEGDVVRLTAASLDTAPGTKIRARLPYENVQGALTSMPALTLVPTQPAQLNQYGTPSPSSWIQVEVGDATGGFLTVRPKGAGSGSSVIYLGGAEGVLPFYDGSGKISEIQVYYNGRTPSTPQEVGALTAVTSVIEESRRSRFEEVVRTENVSARLRTGVIAEVGSGRPATVGSESIRMPASCTPNNRLGC